MLGVKGGEQLGDVRGGAPVAVVVGRSVVIPTLLHYAITPHNDLGRAEAGGAEIVGGPQPEAQFIGSQGQGSRVGNGDPSLSVDREGWCRVALQAGIAAEDLPTGQGAAAGQVGIRRGDQSSCCVIGLNYPFFKADEWRVGIKDRDLMMTGIKDLGTVGIDQSHADALCGFVAGIGQGRDGDRFAALSGRKQERGGC